MPNYTVTAPEIQQATPKRAHVLLNDADAPSLYVIQPTEGKFICDGCGRSTSRGFVVRVFDRSVNGAWARWDYIIGCGCRLDCAKSCIDTDGGAA